jgi:hypothetical protein
MTTAASQGAVGESPDITKVNSQVASSSTNPSFNEKPSDVEGDEPASIMENPPKTNWLVQWFKTQIKIFNPLLLVMATK